MGYVSALLWWIISVNLTMPLVGYVCQLRAEGALVGYVLVQEVTWLMVQEVTLVEALLGMERQSERS